MGERQPGGDEGGKPDWAPPEPFRCEAQGHMFSFYPGGEARREALLGLIREARESIDLCFYIFATDEAAVTVRDALCEAARRGVAVRLMIDSFGATADTAFFASLIDAGGQFCCFSPRWSQRYLIRNHQKFVVADGRRAILGGFNVENGYFAAVPDEDGWVDLGVIVEGPVVEKLVLWFADLVEWAADPKANWRRIRRMVRSWSPGKGAVQLLIGGPTRGLSSWARSVRADIQRAAQVDLMMAYFSPSAGMVRRLGRLARRGRARLVLAGRSDNPATVGASRSLYGYLLKRQAQVWEFTACRLHTKLLVVDDTVYFGSANLDIRSGFLNLELMLRIVDAPLAAQMRAFVAAHLPACEPITPALHRSRATFLKRVRWNLSWFLVTVVDYTVSRRLNLGL